MSKRRAGVAGLGVGIPEKVLTNFDLERMVDTSDEWIRSRTGIVERRIADDSQGTSDLAVAAAEEALERAGITAEELDLIMVATATPDMVFPATAALVQHRLGAWRAAAFDLEAACSGFLYGQVVASQFIETGAFNNILVIGAEILSRIVDWEDRSTCVLFGDAAGAAVLRPTEDGSGLLSFDLGADGGGADLLYLQASGSPRRLKRRDGLDSRDPFLRMRGREVFRLAVKAMQEASAAALEKAGLTGRDVDLFIPHQANLRIIEATAERFGIEMDRVMVNIDRYGNTSAASIPVAWYEAARAGRLKPGDVILTAAFGGGLTFGAAVTRWTGEGFGLA